MQPSSQARSSYKKKLFVGPPGYLSQKQRIRSSHVSSTRLAKKLKVSNIPFTIICCNLLSDVLSGCMFSRAISISEKDSSTLAPDNHPSGTRWWMWTPHFGAVSLPASSVQNSSICLILRCRRNRRKLPNCNFASLVESTSESYFGFYATSEVKLLLFYCHWCFVSFQIQLIWVSLLGCNEELTINSQEAVRTLAFFTCGIDRVRSALISASGPHSALLIQSENQWVFRAMRLRDDWSKNGYSGVSSEQLLAFTASVTPLSPRLT